MDQMWRLRKNNELQQLHGESGILTYILDKVKMAQMQWAGHFQRMREERMPGTIFQRRQGGRRLKERSKKR